MTLAQRWSVRLRLVKTAALEFLLFDSAVFKTVMGLTGLFTGLLLYHCGGRAHGFKVISKIHRSALTPLGNWRVERLIRSASHGAEKGTRRHPLLRVYTHHVANVSPTPHTSRFFDSPAKLLNGSVIVLKSPTPNEKGVILLYYSYIYPLFAKFFHLGAITEQYYLALEPSWSGYCDLNILAYTALNDPVFVGSIEPRDTDFIQRLGSNLVPVPFSSNTWVDHRVFRPLPGVAKNVDILMVAGWADYKRHWAFFSALRRIRTRGVHPKVVLIGYPIGTTKDYIRQEAELYGVADLLEFREWLPADEVNHLLNRAKVNVLWSRREGVNRTIIEGMFAGTPCIVRQGMNYGHQYAHINQHTGRFSTEASLPEDILDTLDRYDRYSPRGWVMANMSCQKATATLNNAIKATALERGQAWTRDLVVKTNELNGLRYWDPDDQQKFLPDYQFLRSVITRPC